METAVDIPASARRLAYYRQNPVALVEDVFGLKPQKWQKPPLWAIAHHPSVAIAGGQGVGKDWELASAFWWHLLTHFMSRCAAISASGKALRVNLWPILSEFYRRSDQVQGLFEMQTNQIVSREFPLEWFLVARTVGVRQAGSMKTAEAAAGMYADDTLFGVDEASGVDDAAFDSIEGTCNTPTRRRIYVGNPLVRSGRFADTFLRPEYAKGVTHFNISYLDAEILSREARAQREGWIKAFGPKSAFVQARVFGQFPMEDSIDTVVPWGLALAAFARELKVNRKEPLRVAGDIARYGSDETVWTVRQGRVVLGQWSFAKLSVPESIARGLVLAREFAPVDDDGNPVSDLSESVTFVVDETGVGGGVVDGLREMGFSCVGIDFGARPSTQAVDNYMDLATEMWAVDLVDALNWIDLSRITGTEQSVLIHEMTSRQFVFPRQGLGRKRLMSKEQLRSQGQHSPDHADSLALAVVDVEKLGARSFRDTFFVA